MPQHGGVGVQADIEESGSQRAAAVLQMGIARATCRVEWMCRFHPLTSSWVRNEARATKATTCLYDQVSR